MLLQYATVRNPSFDSIETLKIPPLGRFYENLPNWIRCSFQKGHGLTEPLDKNTALAKGRLIQFNSANLIRYIVFDVDNKIDKESADDSCFLNWHYADMPPPQIIIRNTSNGHCQYFYELESPVCISMQGKANIQHYLNAIRKAMTIQLNADSAYTHFISKNPLNSQMQEVSYCLVEPYTLDALSKNLDLTTTYSVRNPDDFMGLGRNNDIFHTVRFSAYAYKEKCKTQEQLYSYVLAECHLVNERLFIENMLPENEILTTANSNSDWTWKKYTGRARFKDRKLTVEQAKRGKKGGKRVQSLKSDKPVYKSDKTRYKRNKAAKLLADGMSKTAIAEQLKVSRKTISEWCRKTN